MGLPLVDGHGNFGSIEGDGAAAMRYTEARLKKITQEVYLQDLDKDVVNFLPNFDETEKEPEVLPVRVPNLLVNGAEGIAVGMATSIPTHNLGEVIDGVIAYMKNPDMSTEEMMEYIPGPDFPTGGIVTNKDDLKQIYSTGVGKIKLRGKVEIEKIKGGKQAIVITEIPYTMIGAGIGKFMADVAELAERAHGPAAEEREVVDVRVRAVRLAHGASVRLGGGEGIVGHGVDVERVGGKELVRAGLHEHAHLVGGIERERTVVQLGHLAEGVVLEAARDERAALAIDETRHEDAVRAVTRQARNEVRRLRARRAVDGHEIGRGTRPA
jgi:hypothetical protein